MADVDLGPAVVARVRDAADIIEVVSAHVTLRRQGRRLVGLCPFHDERTPSFSVNPERGLYHCFGCHAGGDTIDFVMRMERLDFPEAVQRLARQFGVQLPPASPQARQRRAQAERHEGLLEEAQAFFIAQLLAPGGATARSELVRRGFDRDSWADIGFGWAPDGWRGLVDGLGRRHPEGALVEAGLAVRPERGGSPYDRFRSRITFPIRTADGRLVAFGGRAVGDVQPKYLNSPESALFEKRSTLFLLDRARRAIADAGAAVVVEGYFDALSLHRVDVRHTVATLGTSLTVEHARILRRLAPRALLCYDADAAGRRAAAAGARVLLAAGLEVAVVVVPSGRDPDDVVREGGADAFRRLLEAPRALLDVLLAEAPVAIAERRRMGAELAELVGAARDPVLRFTLLEELARRLDLPLEVLRERSGGGGPPRGAAASPLPPVAAAPPGERQLAHLLLEGPGARRRRLLAAVDPQSLQDERVRALFAAAAALPASALDDEGDLVRRLIADLPPEVVQLAALLGASDRAPVEDAEMERLLQLAARRGRDVEIRRLQVEITRVERELARVDGELARGETARAAERTALLEELSTLQHQILAEKRHG